MPLVSYRNACFVNNEVSGITIPQETVDRYEGKNREQAERLAILLSVQTAKTDFRCRGRLLSHYTVSARRFNWLHHRRRN